MSKDYQVQYKDFPPTPVLFGSKTEAETTIRNVVNYYGYSFGDFKIIRVNVTPGSVAVSTE